MHLFMIIIALGLACLIRLLPVSTTNYWWQQWQRSLFTFLFPPLLLLTTAIAVIFMGYHGQMLGLPASWFSYSLASLFLIFSLIVLLKNIYQINNITKAINKYPRQMIGQQAARIFPSQFPYCAQIGVIKPKLVISQGLIDSLDEEHLQAVLAHENAHSQYGDSFWFFWFNWLYNCTAWLPNTEKLWQDLLFLREIRADQNATQYVDGLLIAESLLIVNQNIHQLSHFSPSDLCVAFHDTTAQSRLEERIDALLADNNSSVTNITENWCYLGLVLLPLMTVPFHG